MPDRYSGKNSYWNYGGVTIPFTKFTLKGSRKLADATDSADYDQATDLIYPSQIAISTQIKGTIEGRFRRSSVQPALWAALFSSAVQVTCYFGADLQTLFGHGGFDLSDFTVENPYDDIQNYTAEIQSNGKFYPNQ